MQGTRRRPPSLSDSPAPPFPAMSCGVGDSGCHPRHIPHKLNPVIRGDSVAAETGMSALGLASGANAVSGGVPPCSLSHSTPENVPLPLCRVAPWLHEVSLLAFANPWLPPCPAGATGQRWGCPQSRSRTWHRGRVWMKCPVPAHPNKALRCRCRDFSFRATIKALPGAQPAAARGTEGQTAAAYHPWLRFGPVSLPTRARCHPEDTCQPSGARQPPWKAAASLGRWVMG